MSSGAAPELIGTGIVMGVVHVLTGPDHLSALATLAGADVSSRDRPDPFLLGVRWGLGHSVGLLAVGGTLIALEASSSEWIGMSEGMKMAMDALVGVFMMLLGFYGLHRAFRNRAEPQAGSVSSFWPNLAKKGKEPLSSSMARIWPRKAGRAEPTRRVTLPERSPPPLRRSVEIVAEMSEALERDDDEDSGDVEERIFNAVESLRRSSETDDMDGDEGEDQFLTTLRSSAKGALSKSFVGLLRDQPPPMSASEMVQKHATPESSIVLSRASSMTDVRPVSALGRACKACTPGALALLAGLVHGIAGPGGVLGVIPAVQLKDARLAAIYLGTFCLTSVLVMGGFAALYGKFIGWMAKGGGRGAGSTLRSRAFCMELGSACLSLAVGVVLLALLAARKLDDVFP